MGILKSYNGNEQVKKNKEEVRKESAKKNHVKNNGGIEKFKKFRSKVSFYISPELNF